MSVHRTMFYLTCTSDVHEQLLPEKHAITPAQLSTRASIKAFKSS